MSECGRLSDRGVRSSLGTSFAEVPDWGGSRAAPFLLSNSIRRRLLSHIQHGPHDCTSNRNDHQRKRYSFHVCPPATGTGPANIFEDCLRAQGGEWEAEAREPLLTGVEQRLACTHPD